MTRIVKLANFILQPLVMGGISIYTACASVGSQAVDAQRADERRRSAQHGGVRSIGWLGGAPRFYAVLFHFGSSLNSA